MVPGQELSALQLTPVPTTVLARVVVPGKKEGVGDLAAEPARYVNEPDEAYDQGKRDLGSFRTKSTSAVHLEELGLSVEDQANRPSDGNNRQRLVGSIKCKAPHDEDSRLVSAVGPRSPSGPHACMGGPVPPILFG